MSTKGTRISDDWRPSDAVMGWAYANRKDLGFCMDEVIEEFVDYWASLPGSKAVKLDWDRTFKNWLRRCGVPKTAQQAPMRERKLVL